MKKTAYDKELSKYLMYRGPYTRGEGSYVAILPIVEAVPMDPPAPATKGPKGTKEAKESSIRTYELLTAAPVKCIRAIVALSYSDDLREAGQLDAPSILLDGDELVIRLRTDRAFTPTDSSSVKLQLADF